MSEILPTAAHRSRPARRRRPLAGRWLRISWPQWWATDPAAVADEHARWLASQNPATVVRPCPAFLRLDALMSGEGKATSDAMNPASFNRWWQS